MKRHSTSFAIKENVSPSYKTHAYQDGHHTDRRILQMTVSIGEDVEKLEPSRPVGMRNGAAGLENIPKWIDTELSYEPAILLSIVHTRGLETGPDKGFYLNVPSSMTQNSQICKHFRGPPADEWANKTVLFDNKSNNTSYPMEET